MRVLWIATKSPWPPVDGGRLVQALTIEALVDQGCGVKVIVPDVGPASPAPPGIELERVASPPVGRARLLWRRALGEPLTLARHRLAVVGRAAVAAAQGVDVVHVEQLQGLAQAPTGLPVLLRTQNVEHELWSSAAAVSSSLGAWLLSLESAALRRRESALLQRPDHLVALTAIDASTLQALTGREVEVVPAPFPATLDAGPALEGDPAFALLVGAGWAPNLDGAQWFCREVWPRILRARPGARLHCFGKIAAGPGIVVHAPPADSASAFPAGGIVVVPLRVASGVRMKILEAWARGLPVLATSVAAAGLSVAAIATACAPDELAAAGVELAFNRDRRVELTAAGRNQLVEHHGAAAVARRLMAGYERLRRASSTKA